MSEVNEHVANLQNIAFAWREHATKAATIYLGDRDMQRAQQADAAADYIEQLERKCAELEKRDQNNTDILAGMAVSVNDCANDEKMERMKAKALQAENERLRAAVISTECGCELLDISTGERRRVPAGTPFIAEEHYYNCFKRAALDETECSHENYLFDKHGRSCTCGTLMTDFGD